MEMTNPWSTIPLGDYEHHMQHKSVVQAQLLSSLTKKYLQKHYPENILFLGISGGNGLEHIHPDKVKRVCGIDINQSYLDETEKRFSSKIKQLELINADINTSTQSYIKADLIWAALIFEYVDMDKALEFIARNAAESARMIVTIQYNNGANSVSQTGVETVKSVKDIFRVVNGDKLQNTASQFGFELMNLEENILPDGKSFFTYEFKKTLK